MKSTILIFLLTMVFMGGQRVLFVQCPAKGKPIMERDTIEFSPTKADGDWFFHCHILYPMMSGMGRIFHYENTAPNPEIPNPKSAQRMLFADDRMPHFMAKVGLESSGSDGEAMLTQTRWKVNALWNLGLSNKTGYESETMIGRGRRFQ